MEMVDALTVDIARCLRKVYETFYEEWLRDQSPRTRASYERACNSLVSQTNKHPWEVAKEDIRIWVEALGRAGLSDSTRRQYIATVSSFRRYAEMENVTSGMSPRVEVYEQARALSAHEARALTDAIQEEAKVRPIKGWRDLALLGGYLMTGRRPSEWRVLRWGDVRVDVSGAHVTYKWQWHGTTQTDSLPRPIWNAIRRYLLAAGRLEGVQPEDAIFIALTDNATHLPTVKNFDGKQAISDREVCRVLQYYCRRANLDTEKVSLMSLRNTAALLRLDAGDSPERVSRMLGIAHPREMERQLYLAQGTQDSNWVTVAELLGLPDESVARKEPKFHKRIKTG